MARTFRLQIVTPERVMVDAPATYLSAPGIMGYFGVLAGHAPFVTELGIGELRYRDETGAEYTMAIHSGFAQVTGDRTTVLADAAERPEEIDVDRARRALDQAREELRTIAQRYSEAEARRLASEVQRAESRLKVAEKER